MEALPRFQYVPGTELRLLRDEKWVRVVLESACDGEPNTYACTVDGVEEPRVVLTRLNHALVLEPAMDMQSEYVKYGGWIRSNYSFVIDALSGERLDIMLQCVKLNVDKARDEASHDAFEVVIREVQEDQGKPIVVVGEAASGKSTFARLFLIMCIQQMQRTQFVPYLLTTIDLVRIIRQKGLHGDLIDGYLGAVYGTNSRRYLFLKQAR